MSDFDVVIEYAKFWEAYDGRVLCGANSKKGGKAKGLESYKKQIKDQIKADQVLFSLIAQKKQHIECGENNIWASNFPMVSTYLNQGLWDREVDDIEDLKRLHREPDKSKPHVAKVLGQCIADKCTREIHGPRFSKCHHHITITSDFKVKVIASLKEKGVMRKAGEPMDVWRERLRDFVNKTGMIKVKLSE